jgi:hypothetical protein
MSWTKAATGPFRRASYFDRAHLLSSFRLLLDDLRKLLIELAHPTRFERVTFAFGGQRF